jgi:N-acetylated-alpha-linked acidic dipeptidase
MHLKQDYQLRSIWDVIGRIPGSESPNEWVVAGNHRDAWVYGAVDPNSGTAAMLETAHGLGELLKSGWRPKRTILLGSWDAEEEGLIGSTEWGEEHAAELANAAAYFNMDVAVSGPDFSASAVPSLKQFVREVSKSVSSPQGGSVYETWRKTQEAKLKAPSQDVSGGSNRPPAAQVRNDVPVGDLGSGSDYTVFLQHLGVPSTDIGSSGSYGVYHSVFDNFAWFEKFADPDFAYEQQMARVFGLEILRMANADVLPYDYEEYGKEISAYLNDAEKKASEKFGKGALAFQAAQEAAGRFTKAGGQALEREHEVRDPKRLNQALRKCERSLLLPAGLPNRPWYRHAVYAPGQYTGYAAVVIPGVNEAIDKGDTTLTQQAIDALSSVLDGATRSLGE